MKLESIIFNCPLLHKNSLNETAQVVANNIESYLLNKNNFKHITDYLFLLSVKVEDQLFVIQKFHKLKNLSKIKNKLSSLLNANLIIVKAFCDGKFSIIEE